MAPRSLAALKRAAHGKRMGRSQAARVPPRPASSPKVQCAAQGCRRDANGTRFTSAWLGALGVSALNSLAQGIVPRFRMYWMMTSRSSLPVSLKTSPVVFSSVF